MKASMAFSAVIGMTALSTLFAQSAWAEDGIADGTAVRFDLEVLKKKAAALAKQPWGGAPGALPETLATLTPQAYNEIQYDAGHSLRNNIPNRELDVQFFHVGMGFKRRMRMFSVDADSREAREIHFRLELFNYNNAKVDTRSWWAKPISASPASAPLKKPELARRDIVYFLGASYFHAVDETYQYGLSARSIAVNTFSSGSEEFPDFTALWFETPKAEDTTFVAYALLDGASLTGADKFTIHCEVKHVVMEVENHLYACKEIRQLSIAPMTSMFSCGTYEHRMCNTYHPQIHDSDRLAMWSGSGEWIARPLNNPQKLQFNAYEDKNPRGFGLLQLNHDVKDYQDVIGRYDKRPSLWVEPVGKWGKGVINLMEIPTTRETLDNIVCFWQPAEPVKVGSELSFAYKLYWSGLPPVRRGLARVDATRTSIGCFPEQWCRRFAIDFIGDDLKAAVPKVIEPVITLSSGTFKQVEILYVEPINGYRILFDWYPNSDATKTVDMRLFLRTKEETLSETWLYQYFPPPADQRKYVDDRQMTPG
ncbi:glucan biosynthesis protein D [Candidatus Pantoea persica]|uniref:glucan biosynthesis protein D n=1 Tax=Candidatus Pantoea persica TaxID=2518128 RepID=UPI00215DBCAA|nr:glucan biosynthesis protein D [Candidatus Pantoea persica]MBA2816619.1 Glucans biosynthesis protein D precursor [Candidatus Pantoea persica]